MPRQRALKWLWVAIVVQIVGLAFDAIWHGLWNPGFRPATVAEMVRHLATVHLPIYIGVTAVFVTTAWALVEQWRWSGIGVALPVAFVGALIALAGEVWHAYSHLQLSTTHAAPIAGITALFGLTTVVVAVWLARREHQVSAADVTRRRRAA